MALKKAPPNNPLTRNVGSGGFARIKAGGVVRADDDAGAFVLCLHDKGRIQLHYLEPGAGLREDDENVSILVIAAWPTLLLCDKRQ